MFGRVVNNSFDGIIHSEGYVTGGGEEATLGWGARTKIIMWL